MSLPAAAAVAQNCSVNLAALLGRADESLAGLSTDASRHRVALGALRERLAEERLHVAVLGQFKRGKSSFLNALLGAPVLPTAVVPLTAIATFIRWAEVPSIRVTYLDGSARGELRSSDIGQIREQLARFVTEEGNPRNCLRVAKVDLFYPAPILERGIVLIDTPGIGSTLRHNTETAHEVLPDCDAGFFVLSSDPPVTEAELLYLERVRRHVARLFFVLNKIDYLDGEEREAALGFLRRSLVEHLPADAGVPIFCLSARHALEARQRGDAQALQESGLPEIENRLAGFLAREKMAALHEAVAGKAGSLVDAVLMELALAIRALELPAQELKTRAEQFADALQGIARQRLVARDLLAGDRRRAVESLEEEAAQLRREAREALCAVLDRPELSEDAAKAAIAAAIPKFFESKLAELSQEFAALVERTLTQHVARAEALISAVREAAATLFEIPAAPFEGSESFVVRREPYWVTERWSDGVNPLAGGTLDKLLPAGTRAARLKRRLAGEIDELVERNVENLRWATLQNLDAAFHRFAAWFDERLDETIAAMRGAIEAAAARRREHAESVEAEVERLRGARKLLASLREKLREYGRR